MVIKLRCKTCHSKVSADDDLVGKKVYCPACNSVISLPVPQFSSGDDIKGFQVEQWLGSGAMGEVYMANQVSMKRPVALKITKKEAHENENEIKRFLHEAKTLAQLNHPNIVPAYDVGTYQDFHYLAMGYIDGLTVEDLLRKKGRMSESKALRIVIDIARALQYAWNEFHLLHRDIKPGNIMIDNDEGVVKLMDLGIAKHTEEEDNSLTRSGYFVGTPYYMSPEQAQCDAKLDSRSDIYALGCTLYQMLTDTLPFPGSSMMAVLARKINNDFQPASRICHSLSDACNTVINRMIDVNPDERYKNYEELLQAMEACLLQATSTNSVSRASAPEIKAAAKPSPFSLPQDKSLLYVCGGLLILIIICAAVLFTN